MEVSMNLKKRAAGAIAVAMSVVVMTSVAQAAPADYKTGVASQATTTDLATNGIAGIAVSMSQYESDAYEIYRAGRCECGADECCTCYIR